MQDDEIRCAGGPEQVRCVAQPTGQELDAFGMTVSRTDEDGLVGDLGTGGHANRGVDAEQRPAIQLLVNEAESLARGGCRTRRHHSRIVSQGMQRPAESRRGQHLHGSTVVAGSHSSQLVVPVPCAT